MIWLQRPARLAFQAIERPLDRVFSPAWNPLYHLGGLGFFMYWIVAATGIYIYIFFDTGLTEAYDSVDYMTNDQWYLAGVMRSLHRYASDIMVLFMLIHMVREFSLDRYRGARWFTWVSGLPVLGLIFVCGITGYWLVWDKLAQFVAIRTTEWFDWLGIFGTSIAANFLTPESLDDRFFTLMIFIHIAGPLFLLLVLWAHLLRVSRPKIYPPRGLAIGMFLAMIALSLVKPAVSHGPADLSTVVSVVNLDWFYLGLYPLVDLWSAGAVWAAVGVLALTLIVLPWLPPMRRAPAAEVNLDHCNGCVRCADDCPFSAITMQPRSDGAKFVAEAVVDPALCVSCGICVGSCPSSTPFRRRGALLSGIELPHLSLATLTEQTQAAGESMSGDGRILAFVCEYGCQLGPSDAANTAEVRLPCIGMLPPSFIDFTLSRGLADGVLLAGCDGAACHNRFGVDWTMARIDRERDPRLRERVPRERIEQIWAVPGETRRMDAGIAAFRARLKELAAEEEAAAEQVPATQAATGD